MGEQMTMMEFLTFLANCDSEQAMDKIERFQNGGLVVDGVSALELTNEQHIRR
jgi:hypothetical protein